MKATVSRIPPQFPTVTLRITLESPLEVQAMYDLLNLGSLSTATQAMANHEPRVNQDAIGNVASVVWGELADAVGLIGHGDKRIA
jgi:hypothetical protein